MSVLDYVSAAFLNGAECIRKNAGRGRNILMGVVVVAAVGDGVMDISYITTLEQKGPSRGVTTLQHLLEANISMYASGAQVCLVEGGREYAHDRGKHQGVHEEVVVVDTWIGSALSDVKYEKKWRGKLNVAL